MKKRTEYIILLTISTIMFLINSLLMGRLGIYVDEYGIGPSNVWGSQFWNYMNWVVWLLLGVNFVYWFFKTILHKESSVT